MLFERTNREEADLRGLDQTGLHCMAWWVLGIGMGVCIALRWGSG